MACGLPSACAAAHASTATAHRNFIGPRLARLADAGYCPGQGPSGLFPVGNRREGTMGNDVTTWLLQGASLALLIWGAVLSLAGGDRRSGHERRTATRGGRRIVDGRR